MASPILWQDNGRWRPCLELKAGRTPHCHVGSHRYRLESRRWHLSYKCFFCTMSEARWTPSTISTDGLVCQWVPVPSGPVIIIVLRVDKSSLDNKNCWPTCLDTGRMSTSNLAPRTSHQRNSLFRQVSQSACQATHVFSDINSKWRDVTKKNSWLLIGHPLITWLTWVDSWDETVKEIPLSFGLRVATSWQNHLSFQECAGYRSDPDNKGAIKIDKACNPAQYKYRTVSQLPQPRVMTGDPSTQAHYPSSEAPTLDTHPARSGLGLMSGIYSQHRGNTGMWIKLLKPQIPHGWLKGERGGRGVEGYRDSSDSPSQRVTINLIDRQAIHHGDLVLVVLSLFRDFALLPGHR